MRLERPAWAVGISWFILRLVIEASAFKMFRTCLRRPPRSLRASRFASFPASRFSRPALIRARSFLIEPDQDAAEQIPFDLDARNGLFAVAGSVVRRLEGGAKRTYPDANGFVDYDGYLSIHDSTGARLRGQDFDSGRGDVLAALDWTTDGIVAAGAAGWDRWQGGMSISKGADPFFAWLSEDGTQSTSRVLPMSNGSRHFHLHDVAVENDTVVGYGLSDAPMTHSADGNRNAARTYGPLRVTLSPPPPPADAGDDS